MNTTKSITTASLYTDLVELTKIRLVSLVLVTTLVGFVIAHPLGPHWHLLGWTLLGTMLTACGSNALNQWWEVARDIRMQRTQLRPLPAGRMTPATALILGSALIINGTALLWGLVNGWSALLALAAALFYVLIYTPLKPRTTLCTLVGAVVGALPPMLGWAAAVGRLDYGAWILGALLFVWQIPHFLALAWMYREDYARGGFRMLPVEDPSGQLTVRVIMIYSLLQLLISLLVRLSGLAGNWYLLLALLLGGWFIHVARLLYLTREVPQARRLFFASIAYLPLLMAGMLLDHWI
ncbi:MAG: Protoheme IX farnesyltransferase [Phycisphaerae bacterium]|nr:Protoheme IX farnesyltransferase [Phycisphaerae bacterium]